jgi:hypothetical protein
VNIASKGDFIRMKVVKARFARDFFWLIAKDVNNGFRSVQNVGFWCEI